jgi:UPF0176 protein
MTYLTATSYKFIQINNLVLLKEEIQAICLENRILGTILLAPEGINFTISSDAEGLKVFLLLLNNIKPFEDIKYSNLSESKFIPFKKLKIRLKKEIVALKCSEIDLNITKPGEYLNSTEWDALIARDDVMLIDTRNNFEYAYGTFKGAINPNTKSFAELPQWLEKNLDYTKKDQKIAMFCTGGIRCEKSTAYLKSIGFTQVYHIKGGILQYLRDKLSEKESLWDGNLFIFDDRIALDKNLKSITEE